MECEEKGVGGGRKEGEGGMTEAKVLHAPPCSALCPQPESMSSHHPTPTSFREGP